MTGPEIPQPALPRIAGLRVERRIGVGGMAEVFLAVQLSLGRKLALKVLSQEGSISEADAQRFEREARTIAKLDHPHIVGIFDVGRTSDGRLYYTMPFLPGGDLEGRDLRGNTAACVDILRAMTKALAYAHAQGLVHRDVKPANVLFDAGNRPLLADFGIAISADHDLRMTGPGKAMGSTGYMSPEQARGGELDGRSDIYALGIVCYEMLVGDVPFGGKDSFAIAFAHLYDPVPRLPGPLLHWQAFIDKALAKTPEQRFQTAEEMEAALDVVLSEQARSALDAQTRPLSALDGNTAERKTRKVPRWLLPTLLLMLVVIGVALQRVMAVKSAPADPAVAITAQAAPPTASNAAALSAAVLDASALDAQLAAAYKALKAGRLFEPPAENAADGFLAVLAQAPGSAEAAAGLSDVYAAAAKRAETALAAGNVADAHDLYTRCVAIAQRNPQRDNPALVEFSRRYAAATRAALEKAARNLDGVRALALQPAIADATASDPGIAELAARWSKLPKPGLVFSDSGGPSLALLPASGAQSQPFGLMTTEVTRADYLAFAKATRRPAAKCRDSGLFGALRRRDVGDPGFEQTDRDPVVCVSVADAEAYASALSSKTHARYRLPTRAEWLAAAGTAAAGNPCKLGNLFDADGGRVVGSGRYDCHDGFRDTAPVARFAPNAYGIHDLIGNVREWTADCVADGKEKCAEHLVAGSSMRDGNKVALLGADEHQDSAVGAPSVGFRLLREVSLDALPAEK